MHFSLQSLAQLERLSQALEDPGDDLQAMLAVLIDDLTAAVPSFTGLSITIAAAGHPVTVAAVDQTPSRTSMMLPLHLTADLPAGSELVLYAADPGAFEALAADTRATYGLDGQVELDRHLPPPRPSAGTAVLVDGVEDQSTINQAIGVLLEQGILPEEAATVLAGRAAAQQIPPLQIAQQILGGGPQLGRTAASRPASPPGPNSEDESTVVDEARSSAPAPATPPRPPSAERADLDGLDGYPHRWAGNFPHLAVQQPGTDQRPDTFAAALAELALTVKNEGAKSETHAMTVITQGAAAIITGTQHAAVVVPAGPRQMAARAAHGDLPPVLMNLQNTFGEGPCLQAMAQTTQVVVADLSTEIRWPRFTAAALQHGAASMLCTPLTADGKTLGSLSLISTQPEAFDGDAASLAAVFAAHATVALLGVNDVRNLTAMADNRDLIGQAKGVLMERHQLTADQAFQLLVRASQTTNTKLRDICQQLTTTGYLPT